MKIVLIIVSFLNLLAWSNSFESNRTNKRNNRPEIKEQLDKNKLASEAAEKKAKEQEAKENKIKELKAQSGLSNDFKAIQLSEEEVFKRFSFLNGSAKKRSNSGEEIELYYSVSIWKTSAEDLEPNQWNATVYVMNKAKPMYFKIYRSNPTFKDGILNLELLPTQKEKFVNNYSVSDLDIDLQKFIFGIDEKENLYVNIKEQYSEVPFVTKAQNIDQNNISKFLGKWKGRMGESNDKVATAIEFYKESEHFGSTLYYYLGGSDCKTKTYPFYVNDEIYLHFASSIGHSMCFGGTLRVKLNSSGLMVAHYDSRYDEPLFTEQFKK